MQRGELWLLLPNITAKPKQGRQQISPKNTKGLGALGFFSPSLGPIRYLNTSSGQARERGRELMQLGRKELR